jgi:plasmid maintenance system killer protein
LIASFADKRTAAIFAGYAPRKGISSRLAAETLARMQQLHAATALTDLRTPPGNRLEALKGNRRDNSAFASTANGGSAFAGKTITLTTSSLSTTMTRRAT